MTEGWSVGVVVPARDEADRIGACLFSLRASLGACLDDGSCRQARIVVVADRCGDATAVAARRALGPHDEVLEVDVGNVGAARRHGTDRLLGLLGPGGGRTPDTRCASGTSDPSVRPSVGPAVGPVDRARTWLLTTDADTVVPLDWVGAHLRLAEAGTAAVAGVVRVDTFAAHAVHADAVRRGFADTYAMHPDGTHPHVHGANLGVRADAYLAAGGWPALTTAEDHALWVRLRTGGWPTVSSIDAWVTTSGRPVGRAPRGFADHLVDLAPAVGHSNVSADRAGGTPSGQQDRGDGTSGLVGLADVADVVDLAARPS